VHFVDEEYDTGPILAQRCVAVYPTDSPKQLAARVLQQVRRDEADSRALHAGQLSMSSTAVGALAAACIPFKCMCAGAGAALKRGERTWGQQGIGSTELNALTAAGDN
jgi:hypothetical protein